MLSDSNLNVVVLGLEIGDCEHLIEQSAVLCGDAGADGQAADRSQRPDHREEFDRFGSRAEDDENFGHDAVPRSTSLTTR